MQVARMLYASNDLERARSIFVAGIKRSPASTVDYPAAVAGLVEVAGDTETKPRGGREVWPTGEGERGLDRFG